MHTDHLQKFRLHMVFTFGEKMMDKILYEVNRNDIPL